MVVAGIYVLGILRHALERRFNDGNSFSIFFKHYHSFNEDFEKIDYSVSSTLIDGVSSLFNLAFALFFLLIFVAVCYKVGYRRVQKRSTRVICPRFDGHLLT